MTLEDLPDSDKPTSRVQGAGGIIEALSSGSSLENNEHLASILRMASGNANLASGVMQSTIIGTYSASGSNTGHDASVNVPNLSSQTGFYFQSQDRNNMEPYLIPSSSSLVPYSHNVPMSGYFPAGNFSHLFQRAQNTRGIQHLGPSKASSNLFNLESHSLLEPPPAKRKQELGPVTQILKKPRYDVNLENIQQQQFMPQVLLKELQERNPRLKAQLMQYKLQSQLQQPVLGSAPQIRGPPLQLPMPVIRNLPQEQNNQQVSFTPVLDSGHCYRRFMQYLCQMKNWQRHSNITDWKTLVSEYFAPGSKKMWCFSTYKNVEQHAAGVFCRKPMEPWHCVLCGSRSGNWLEATFEILPRLFVIEFMSGMLDEILFVDLPRVRTLSSELLILEFGKAIQESVYKRFRVVHEGKLRVVFRKDLKMLSWEFCAQKHEEFLLHNLVAPQVDQLVQAARKYHDDIQNGVQNRISSDDLRTNCNMIISAGNQLASNVASPLVSALGYPKKFIRCLQIGEAVNSMQDLMKLSRKNRMGPIEILTNYFQGRQTGYKMKEKQEKAHYVDARQELILREHPRPGFRANDPHATDSILPYSLGKSNLAISNTCHQSLGQSSSNAYTKRRNMQESCSSYQSKASSPPSLASRLHNAARLYSSPGSQPSDHNKNPPHQAQVDKLLPEMATSGRGNSMQDTHGRLSEEAARESYKNGTFSSLLSGAIENYATSNELRIRDASPQLNYPSSSLKPANVPKVGSHGNVPAAGSSIKVKAERFSPEDMPESFHSSKGTGDLE